MSSVISAGTSTGSALNFTGDTSGSLALATNNGVTAVTIDTAQNVGIGTTSPGSYTKLTVNGGISTLGNQGNGVWNSDNTNFAYLQNPGSSGANNGVMSFNMTNKGELMRLTSGGLLGIGQSSPAAMVDVYGSNGVTSGYSAGTSMPYMLRLFNSSSGVTGLTAGIQLQTRSGDQSGALWNIGAVAHSGGSYSNLVFQQQIASAFTEAGRFDINGNLLVGTPTLSGGFANSRMAVNQPTAGWWVATFINAAGSVGDGGIQVYGGQNDSSSWLINACQTSGTARFRVVGNGNAQNTNNSYGALSDIKLKENIVDTTPKLADLMQVRIRNYNLIGEEHKQIGVVAQELETVFPGLVETHQDFENVEETDENGNPATRRQPLETTTKSVKYSVFVPMLIKAMQEQQEIITGMQAEIAALKAKVGA